MFDKEGEHGKPNMRRDQARYNQSQQIITKKVTKQTAIQLWIRKIQRQYQKKKV